MSRDKIATQSTTFLAPSDYVHAYVAGNVVDRNVTTCMRTEGIGGNSPEKTVWWEVDLGGVHSIYSVDIVFKSYDGWGIILHIY